MDWEEAYADLDGERIKLQVFALRLMASGGAFHRAYPCATQQAFWEGHEQAFTYPMVESRHHGNRIACHERC
ncbi:MAG: hypothetical protein ABI197_01720 [Granulicella sp.]